MQSHSKWSESQKVSGSQLAFSPTSGKQRPASPPASIASRSSIVGRADWNDCGERTALPQLAIENDVTAEQARETPTDAEAESGSTGASGGTLLDLPERLET